ncbi:MAG: tetratricopeptide repeat protein, partial [Myxococcales bacterium]|nr:tetratricopeptide repeat protein [Myxococcales bacterium]
EIDAIETQLDLARALDFTGRFDEALQQSMSLLPRVEALGWRPLEAETRFLVASAQLHAGKPEAARDEGVRAYYAAVAGGDERRAMLIASKQGTFEGDRLANPARGREWCQLALMHLEHLRLGGTYYEADILANLSGVELRAGKLEEAERLGQRSLEIYRATLGPAHLQTAAAINNQGAIERAMGHYDEALASFRTALELRRLVLGPEHPEVATSIHNIGVILWQQHELDEALEILQQALALRERALGSKHPSVSMSLNALGAVLSGLGRDAESLAAFERALAIDEETLGPTHPDLAGSLTNVANLRRSMGDAERALADHRRALAIWEDALGPEHPYVAVALTNIGAVLTQQEKYDEALEVHQRALAVRETALGLEHPDVAQSLANIGAIYNISQRPALAVASFRRALAIREAALGAEHFSVVESHADLGAALYATGSLAEAQTELEASLRGLEAMGDDEEGIHAYRAVVGFQLAKVAWDRGRKSEAVDFAEEARAQQVTYEQGKVPAAEEVDLSLAEIDDWLAAHSAAPVTSK